ncbi:alanine/ornithine racemase family PLP-dependent enzyme [Bifidobacterium sp. ESL0763]|uniref:alanine/ornithine racemase family PLP-dependent enzyme n=1 Tax=Bifidobacterium sp. ESL0763 TaxID=2983227 RepID=UPI0023FA3F73|nr:alanine/ornithine racemase family PLP-dependent enzyme [Bifidobacterium sp. ESL0763]MDF7663727.1 alanine/ornithine racemase family PLP-dependent enzyme [Bifidobacterium sp. ESL0763]
MHTKKIEHNARVMVDLCAKNGVTVSGVIKGASGLLPVCNAFRKGGVSSLSSSRMPQLRAIKEIWPDQETLLLRIPMMCELDEVIRYADVSLESDVETLKALDARCLALGRTHRVILMVDLGDLREGFFEDDDLYAAAKLVEDAKGLVLEGIGTNLGCYGSIEPDAKNLGRLCSQAEHIESMIGRKLAVVSGGSTTSIPLLLDGTMPKGVNQLRVGTEVLMLDEEKDHHFEVPGIYGDAFTLEAQLIEKRRKATFPIGTLSVDAFGNKPHYVDRGRRIRGLIAVGRQDVGDMTQLHPQDERIKVYGGSSDHTILDLEDCADDYAIGDIVSFTMDYENLMHSSLSPYVAKEFVDD